MIAFPASRLALVPLLMLAAPAPPSSPVQQAGPESLVGIWTVDLRPTPDAEAYLQEFVVSGVEDGTQQEAGMDTVSMKDLVGEWTATSRLQVTPDSPVRESRSTASVALVAQGRFTEIRYTWAEGGQPQDGLMLIATRPGKGPADVTWVDSWHMGDAAMFFTNAPGGDAMLDARGTYPAPSGPDWGWRIVIRPESRDAFQLLMFNITPDGQEMVAVDATYTRRT